MEEGRGGGRRREEGEEEEVPHQEVADRFLLEVDEEHQDGHDEQASKVWRKEKKRRGRKK